MQKGRMRMDQYNRIVEMWRSYKIKSVADLDKYFNNFRILFAYHSGFMSSSNMKPKKPGKRHWLLPMAQSRSEKAYQIL